MPYKKRFCTVVNCMDGRVQIPVINFLQEYFDSEYVDSITEPGPVKIIANGFPNSALKSIHARIKISVEKHNSVGIAIAGHYNCAGNPETKKVQIEQIKKSVQKLNLLYPEIRIIGIWINRKWKVTHKPKEKKPLIDWIKPQGRFKHLFTDQPVFGFFRSEYNF